MELGSIINRSNFFKKNEHSSWADILFYFLYKKLKNYFMYLMMYRQTDVRTENYIFVVFQNKIIIIIQIIIRNKCGQRKFLKFIKNSIRN